MKKTAFSLLIFFLMGSLLTVSAQNPVTPAKSKNWKIGLNVSISNTPRVWNEEVIKTSDPLFWHKVSDLNVGLNLSRNLGKHWELRGAVGMTRRTSTIATDCPWCLILPQPEDAVTSHSWDLDAAIGLRYYLQSNQKGFFGEINGRFSPNLGRIYDSNGEILKNSQVYARIGIMAGYRFSLSDKISLDAAIGYEHGKYLNIGESGSLGGFYNSSLGGVRFQTGISFKF